MCDLTARPARGMAWERHGHGMLCVNRPLTVSSSACGTGGLPSASRTELRFFRVKTGRRIQKLHLIQLLGELVWRVDTPRYCDEKVHLRAVHYGPEGEERYGSTLSLTSALGGVCVVNSTPRPRYPRERPGTHCTGAWVGPMAGLDGCGKSRRHRHSIPGPFRP